MNIKKLLKELERALKQDPENLVLRLKVAAALREVGRRDEAVAMYRSVAVAYHKQNRLAQAIAVCRSVLEIEPSQRETQALLAELDIARQNKDALVPFAASLPPPTGTTPRPRSATSPPPRAAPPPSVPSLPRLQPVGGRGSSSPVPPPLPPASASGITPLPLPSIGSITPLPDHDDFLSPPPRLPLPAQPSGPMAAQSPPAREPAGPSRPPPAQSPAMRRNTGAPPPSPAPPPGRGTPPANAAAPRAPRQDLPVEPSGPQLTVPGRPLARMTAPLPGVTQSPASTPPPQRVAPALPPRPTAPPPPRTSESAPRPPARLSETPPPRTSESAPRPPARLSETPPPRQPAPAPPPARAPMPPAMRPPASPPPSPSSSLPAPRPPSPPARPLASPARPPVSVTRPPVAAPAAPPPARRKKPTSVSQMTPTPLSTPLPPPHAATPTPADAGPPSAFRPPYVHVPGQDDDGMTLPTIKSKVASTTGMRPRAGADPVEDMITAGEDEATRIADEPHESHEPDDDSSTRVADEPRAGMSGPASRARLPALARPAASPASSPPRSPPRPTAARLPPSRPSPSMREDDSATRVADDPAAIAAAFEAISADDDAPTGGLERLSPDVEVETLGPEDDGVVDGTDTGDDDNATRVAAEPRDVADEGPLLDEGPPARAFPADLAPFSRADRLLDVGWPAGKGRDTAEHVHIGEHTEPGQSLLDDPVERTADEGDDGNTNTAARGSDGKRKTTISRIKPAPEPGDDTQTTRHDRLEPDEVNTGGPTAVSVDTDAGDDDDAEDGLELARAFDRGFGPDLGELAPDGSTIEQPLPLFARLSREALSELQRRMSFRRCAAGDLILREGDPGDACYVVYSGSVRVLKRDPSGSSTDVIEIARLGPGAIFGEFALLADRRRHASVQALEACELYEIPRRLLSELAAEYADVGPALERFYRERLLSTLLATAPFFQPLPEEERGNLMTRFVPRRVEAGGAIIREGEPGGGLYLVVLGTVDITRRADGKRAVLLATLGEGAYFGEMSLLSGGRASATVTAAGPAELAQLSPRDFYEIVSTYPVIWEQLRREAHRRELLNQNILAGDTRMV